MRRITTIFAAVLVLAGCEDYTPRPPQDHPAAPIASYSGMPERSFAPSARTLEQAKTEIITTVDSLLKPLPGVEQTPFSYPNLKVRRIPSLPKKDSHEEGCEGTSLHHEGPPFRWVYQIWTDDIDGVSSIVRARLELLARQGWALKEESLDEPVNLRNNTDAGLEGSGQDYYWLYDQHGALITARIDHYEPNIHDDGDNSNDSAPRVTLYGQTECAR